MAELLQAGDESSDTYIFQLIDVKVLDRLPPQYETDRASIHGDTFVENAVDLKAKYSTHCTVVLIGCTEKGNSILVKVDDFMPYLFYRKKPNETEEIFRSKLANKLDLKDDSLLKTKIIKRKNLYGWEPNSMSHPTDRKEYEFIQVFFPNVQYMRKAIYNKVSDDFYMKPHETQITAETKFVDLNDVVPCGWIEVKGEVCDIDERISHCKIEIGCHMNQLIPLPNKNDIAPLMVAAIDIECISSTGAFPEATNIDDVISMIGVVYWRMNSPKESAVKCVYVVGECADIKDSYVYSFASEAEMLSAFRTSLILDADPDIIATYNGFGFDCEYMWKRAELLHCEDFTYLDRLIVSKSKGDKKELSSSALGSNELFIISMIGRCNLDIFHWIKAREKLSSYKLDNVCEHFLGERKLEMDYKELFKLARGTPIQVAEVAEYCIQDCALLISLILHLAILAGNVEMSRVCFTPMEALVTRGQQFKVVNQIIHYGHREGLNPDGNGSYIMNTPEKYSGDPEDSYEGATVIDAKASYYKVPIAVLDFMSLYPSIMMANNFCHSTIVMDPKFLNIPGVKYETIRVTDKKVYTWAEGMPGLLPIMLEKLLAARKIAKKAKSNAKTSTEKAVYDARQLALKISANSIYGFTGAVKMGKYHCLGVADSTTYRAREMLHQTQTWVKELYPCDVVYGDTDSIMVKFDEGKTIEEAFALGDVAADKITEMFSEKYNTKKIVLEMEKVYYPYLLMRKKRYAGLMYEKNKEGKVAFSYLDAKGIELVRRDNCPLAKRIQQSVLDALMYKIDGDLACKHVHDHMKLIVNDQIPLMDYKMSKSRRKEYVNEDLPHLEVCRKMSQRNPGSEPQIGDRVPFILIETPNLKAKTFEKAEDPKYIEENGLKVDRLYYTEHQIVNSICSLMDLVVDDPNSLFTDHLRELKLQRTKQNSIFSFLKPIKVDEKREVQVVQNEVKQDDVMQVVQNEVKQDDVMQVVQNEVKKVDEDLEKKRKMDEEQKVLKKSKSSDAFEEMMMNMSSNKVVNTTKKSKSKKR